MKVKEPVYCNVEDHHATVQSRHSLSVGSNLIHAHQLLITEHFKITLNAEILRYTRTNVVRKSRIVYIKITFAAGLHSTPSELLISHYRNSTAFVTYNSHYKQRHF
jgi:hypothetical protein